MQKNKQLKIFKGENNWEDEWVGMPSYNNVKQPEPLITATFKFKTEKDFLQFKKIVQKHVYNGAKVFDGMQKKDKKNAWYPHKEKASKYKYV